MARSRMFLWELVPEVGMDVKYKEYKELSLEREMSCSWGDRYRL